ncbi:MAG: nucleoside monophosphate kinase [Spirulinaceae cyanobacterium]
MRLVILGGPGVGKGTQSQRLCDHFQIPRVAMGDILRSAIAKQTDLGRKAEDYVKKGELVPDQILIQFMRQRLNEPDVSKGWLLEGYPRTAFQAEELDFLLDEFAQKLNWAIYLQAPEEVMKERSLGRSLADDQPEILQRRITSFQERTVPILEYYSPRQKLLTVDATSSPDMVEQAIVGKITN